MKEIKCLVESMKMELDAADCYYKKALSMKESYPQVATVYIEVASQELAHCDKFHVSAVSLINKRKMSGETVPEAMQAIWDYEHQNIMEDYDELKYKITKFSV